MARRSGPGLQPEQWWAKAKKAEDITTRQKQWQSNTCMAWVWMQGRMEATILALKAIRATERAGVKGSWSPRPRDRLAVVKWAKLSLRRNRVQEERPELPSL